jgi:hypothetical protein
VHTSAYDQAGVMLFAALYAFFQEHRRFGDLDSGVEGDRVRMTCTCGAAINRNADRD